MPAWAGSAHRCRLRVTRAFSAPIFPHCLRLHLTGVIICHDICVDLVVIRAEHQTLLRVLQEMMLILMGPSIAETNQSPDWDETPSSWEADRFRAAKAVALTRAYAPAYAAAKARDAEEAAKLKAGRTAALC